MVSSVMFREGDMVLNSQREREREREGKGGQNLFRWIRFTVFVT